MNRDIVLIRALAEGIKEINEHKIMLYQKAHDKMDNIMESVVTIESALLQKHVIISIYHIGNHL